MHVQHLRLLLNTYVWHCEWHVCLQEQQPHLSVLVPSDTIQQPTPMDIEELSDSEGLYGDVGRSTERNMPQAAAAAIIDASEACERLRIPK